MPQSSSDPDLLSLDDSFLSVLFNDGDDDDNPPFTDDEYAQHLQLQETLYSSSITPQKPKDNDPSASSSSPFLKMAATSTTPETEHLKHANETCELSLQVICEICAETRGDSQMFTNQKCRHSFCSDCVAKQVATKIQDSITVVPCPGLDCNSVLELDACRPWLPKDLLERWEQALCEAMFLASTKVYCPFKDCSAMLLVEDEEEVGQQAVREAECPVCHKLFCAKCNVPWHPGIECEEYQNLNENERQREDLIAMEFAKEKQWKRCPNCRFYVERTEGCLHISCRCQFEFCYGCGEKWSSTHVCCHRD